MKRFGKAYRAKPATAGFPSFAVGSEPADRIHSRNLGVMQIRWEEKIRSLIPMCMTLWIPFYLHCPVFW